MSCPVLVIDIESIPDMADLRVLPSAAAVLTDARVFQDHAQKSGLVRDSLAALAPAEPHWDEYLRAWA